MTTKGSLAIQFRLLKRTMALAAVLLSPLTLPAQEDDKIPTARTVPEKTQNGRVFATAGIPVDVNKRINQFFAALKKKDVKNTYDLLLGDSEMAKDTKTMEQFREISSKLIKDFGVFEGHETLRAKPSGSRLLKMEVAAYAKSNPFLWTFYFYKTKTAWKVIDVNVNNKVQEMFEEK